MQAGGPKTAGAKAHGKTSWEKENRESLDDLRVPSLPSLMVQWSPLTYARSTLHATAAPTSLPCSSTPTLSCRAACLPSTPSLSSRAACPHLAAVQHACLARPRLPPWARQPACHAPHKAGHVREGDGAGAAGDDGHGERACSGGMRDEWGVGCRVSW